MKISKFFRASLKNVAFCRLFFSYRSPYSPILPPPLSTKMLKMKGGVKSWPIFSWSKQPLQKQKRREKWRKRWQFFYSANPAFHIKHIQEIWLYRLKPVHCLMTNNKLWYHPPGTFYGPLENMDFVPYVRISRIYYYIWNLWNNVNVTDLIMCNQQLVLREINHNLVKVSIFKFQIMPKNTA